MAATILVPDRQRHLKWAALDPLEGILMVLCGLTLFAFSSSVIFDIITRTIGRPWLWLQEVTSTFFVYGIFIGAAVASRRNEHLTGKVRTIVEVLIRIVILGVALSMVVHGYQNFIRGFGSFRMPSHTPIASLYAAIPISGALIVLFTIEQLINGLKNGFEHPADPFVSNH
jgi:TRAP-type C4-dicarboxylate transport system permease small subunit